MRLIFNRADFIQEREKEYLGCLPSSYHRAYFVWKDRVLPGIDRLVQAAQAGLNCSLEDFQLSEKDFQRALEIGYFTDAELGMLGVVANG